MFSAESQSSDRLVLLLYSSLPVTVLPCSYHRIGGTLLLHHRRRLHRHHRRLQSLVDPDRRLEAITTQDIASSTAKSGLLCFDASATAPSPTFRFI